MDLGDDFPSIFISRSFLPSRNLHETFTDDAFVSRTRKGFASFRNESPIQAWKGGNIQRELPAAERIGGREVRNVLSENRDGENSSATLVYECFKADASADWYSPRVHPRDAG